VNERDRSLLRDAPADRRADSGAETDICCVFGVRPDCPAMAREAATRAASAGRAARRTTLGLDDRPPPQSPKIANQDARAFDTIMRNRPAFVGECSAPECGGTAAPAAETGYLDQLDQMVDRRWRARQDSNLRPPA
jgi:hypothetical protein